VVGLDASRLGYGPVVGSCECDNMNSGCIQGSEFYETLSDCQLLKMTWSDEVSLSVGNHFSLISWAFCGNVAKRFGK
jgi:hypothetical protein